MPPSKPFRAERFLLFCMPSQKYRGISMSGTPNGVPSTPEKIRLFPRTRKGERLLQDRATCSGLRWSPTPYRPWKTLERMATHDQVRSNECPVGKPVRVQSHLLTTCAFEKALIGHQNSFLSWIPRLFNTCLVVSCFIPSPLEQMPIDVHFDALDLCPSFGKKIRRCIYFARDMKCRLQKKAYVSSSP